MLNVGRSDSPRARGPLSAGRQLHLTCMSTALCMQFGNKQTNNSNTPHFTFCTAIPLPAFHTAPKRWWSRGSTMRQHCVGQH